MKKKITWLLFISVISFGQAQDYSLLSHHSKIISIETHKNKSAQINSNFTPVRIENIGFSFREAIIEKESIIEEITIYPNPVAVDQSWSIKNVPLNSIIEIYNSLGQKIGKSILNTSSVVSFDENLSKGAYFVKVHYDNSVKTLKLIIR